MIEYPTFIVLTPTSTFLDHAKILGEEEQEIIKQEIIKKQEEDRKRMKNNNNSKKIEKKLESAKTLDEYVEIKKEIEEYYSNYVLKIEHTDKQHRIVVPAEVKLGTKIKAIGCKNYLLLKTIE